MPLATIERVESTPELGLDRRPVRRAAAFVVAVVVLIGALATGLVGLHLWRKPPIYLATVNVLFRSPDDLNASYSYIDTSSGVIATAGTVAAMVQPSSPYAPVSSTSVSLADEGVRNGWSVTLPNDGGQWTDNFDQALLQVQVVGSSDRGVTTKLYSLIGQIKAKLDLLQTQVPSSNRIRTTLSPSVAQTFQLRGSRVRSAGATLLLGTVLTMLAAVGTRRVLVRRSRRG